LKPVSRPWSDLAGPRRRTSISRRHLPTILAGRGNGTVKPGRHIRYSPDTPMANLFVSMLDRMGVEPERFGDSKGKLDRLSI
jgi:hypothetical protein